MDADAFTTELEEMHASFTLRLNEAEEHAREWELRAMKAMAAGKSDVASHALEERQKFADRERAFRDEVDAIAHKLSSWRLSVASSAAARFDDV